MKKLLFIIICIPFFVTAQIETGSFDFDGHDRNYMVFLPTNYTGTVNFSLLSSPMQHPRDFQQLI